MMDKLKVYVFDESVDDVMKGGFNDRNCIAITKEDDFKWCVSSVEKHSGFLMGEFTYKDDALLYANSLSDKVIESGRWW